MLWPTFAARPSRATRFWIYYAGHASPQDEDVYWVTHDADVDDLFKTALNRNQINSVLEQLEHRNVLLLLDCCNAGGFKQNRTRATMAPKELFKHFAGHGVINLAACDDRQSSVELDKVGHGAFTFYLVQGLRGDADANGDGVVTADELWDYLRSKVEAAAGKAGIRQTPMRSGEMTHDVPLTVNSALATTGAAERVRAVPEPEPEPDGAWRDARLHRWLAAAAMVLLLLAALGMCFVLYHVLRQPHITVVTPPLPNSATHAAPASRSLQNRTTSTVLVNFGEGEKHDLVPCGTLTNDSGEDAFINGEKVDAGAKSFFWSLPGAEPSLVITQDEDAVQFNIPQRPPVRTKLRLESCSWPAKIIVKGGGASWEGASRELPDPPGLPLTLELCQVDPRLSEQIGDTLTGDAIKGRATPSSSGLWLAYYKRPSQFNAKDGAKSTICVSNPARDGCKLTLPREIPVPPRDPGDKGTTRKQCD